MRGAVVNKVDKWGKRRLAYRVDKYREGEYVLIEFQAGAQTVHEFERRLRVNDIVIKFLTVRIDEDLKRIEKRKKHREKRASRKATAAPATPQPSVAQQIARARDARGAVKARHRRHHGGNSWRKTGQRVPTAHWR